MSGRGRHDHPMDPVMLGMVFAAVEQECGHRECAWCGRFLGLAPGIPLGAVTHGMCEPVCGPAREMGWDTSWPGASIGRAST